MRNVLLVGLGVGNSVEGFQSKFVFSRYQKILPHFDVRISSQKSVAFMVYDLTI